MHGVEQANPQGRDTAAVRETAGRGIAFLQGASTDAGSQMMLVSVFPRIALTHGTHVDLDWPAFVARYLSHHDVRPRKDGQLFSCAVYRDDPHRSDANVRGMTGVVIDFDNSIGVGNDARVADTPTLPADHESNLDGLTYAYYSTHSSTATWPRWRLVIPLDREVAPHEWPAVWDGAYALLGRDPNIDASCRELSRAYYTPSCAPDHVGEAFHGAVEGICCTVDTLIGLSAVDVGAPNVTPLRAEIMPASRAEGRNNALKAVCAAMLTRGEPVESIAIELLREDAKHSPPLFTDLAEGYRSDAASGALLFAARVIASINSRRVRNGLPAEHVNLRGLAGAQFNAGEAQFLQMVGSAMRDLSAPQWLIRGYLERCALSVIYGEPGAGKSFIELDRCLHIATGRPWHGHEVKQGPVVYVCGEGRAGVLRRIEAWRRWHEVDLTDTPLALTRIAVPMYDARAAAFLRDEISRMVDAMGAAPVHIGIDTVARNFGGGDENKTSDMGVFIAHLYEYLIDVYRCGVELIHHVGKDAAKGARGSSALRGAVDAEFRVKRDENSGRIEFRSEKMKDAELPRALYFDLTPVSLPIVDEYGEPAHSVVPVAIQDEQPVIDVSAIAGAAKVRRTREGGREAPKRDEAIEILRELLDAARARLSEGGFDPGAARVALADFRTECFARALVQTRNGFYKIKDRLAEMGLIQVSGAWIEVIEP